MKILIFKLLKIKNIKEFNNFNFWKKKLKKNNINQELMNLSIKIIVLLKIQIKL